MTKKTTEQLTLFPSAPSLLHSPFKTVSAKTFEQWSRRQQLLYLARRDDDGAARAEDDPWWKAFHEARAAAYRQDIEQIAKKQGDNQ